MSAVIDVDLGTLTVEELAAMYAAVGLSPAEVRDLEETDRGFYHEALAELMVAAFWVVTRRHRPDFTLDDARDIDAGQVEWFAADPGPDSPSGRVVPTSPVAPTPMLARS